MVANETLRVPATPETFLYLPFFLFAASTDFDNPVSTSLVDDRPHRVNRAVFNIAVEHNGCRGSIDHS